MGTAKYDHPGYIADTGALGKYYVGVWCPHGYPAHIHIGSAQGAVSAEAGIRLRFPDGAFQSIADDFETLCRRAIGQALETGLLNGGQGGFQETRLVLGTEPWQGPMQAAVAKPATQPAGNSDLPARVYPLVIHRVIHARASPLTQVPPASGQMTGARPRCHGMRQS